LQTFQSLIIDYRLRQCSDEEQPEIVRRRSNKVEQVKKVKYVECGEFIEFVECVELVKLVE
jgi:hypothetical protein